MTYIDTRTFKSGDGVAVPLPADLGVDPDTPVRIERSGDRITLIPIRPDRDWIRDRERLLAALKALGPIVPREIRDTDPIPERPRL